MKINFKKLILLTLFILLFLIFYPKESFAGLCADEETRCGEYQTCDCSYDYGWDCSCEDLNEGGGPPDSGDSSDDDGDSSGGSGSSCESHHHVECYGGDSYWYDSCGNREEMDDECVDRTYYCQKSKPCTEYYCEGKCENGTCSGVECSGNYDEDSCGGCPSGQVCHNGDCCTPDCQWESTCAESGSDGCGGTCSRNTDGKDCGNCRECQNGSCTYLCEGTDKSCYCKNDSCFNCNDEDGCYEDDCEYCKNGNRWEGDEERDYYCSGGDCEFDGEKHACNQSLLNNCQGNGCLENNCNSTCKPEAKMDCDKTDCENNDCSETYQASSDEKPCFYTLVNNSTDPDGNDDIKETRWYIREKDDSGCWGINGSCDSGCEYGSYNQEEHYSDEDDGKCKYGSLCTDKETVYVGENYCSNNGSGSCYKLENPITVYENCKAGESCGWFGWGDKESVSDELTGYKETKECQWITDSNYELMHSCSDRDCDYTFPPNRTPGNYVIKLEVEDEFGAKASTTQSLTILKEIQADFKCSLSPEGNWKECDEVDVSTEETLFFKDTSTLSENATQFTSWEWQQNGSTFSNEPIASTTIENTDDEIKLIVEDNKNRKDSEEKTINATLPLPEWEEAGL